MPRIIILDTETTGLIEPIEAIEVAWQEVVFEDQHVDKTTECFLQRFKPSKPIEFVALATSHILMSELLDCEPSSSFKLPEDTEYLIGHNIDYDWKVLGKPNVKRICTKAMAPHLIPNIDSYSQSALLYYFHGEFAKPLLKEAHNALDDINNNFRLLNWLLDLVRGGIYDIEELWKFSEHCRVPTVMPFGKHKGELIKDVPLSYKQWLRNQPDVDEYLLKAIA